MKVLYLWMAAFCCTMAAAAGFGLTEQPGGMRILTGGETYSVNTAPDGTWKNGELLRVGESSPERLSIALSAGGMSLQPVAVRENFRAEVNTPERIVISGSYRLADVHNPKNVFQPLEMTVRYEFAAGVPGVVVSGRISALVPAEVQSLTVSAGQGYSTYSLNGEKSLEHPRAWTPLIAAVPEMKGQDYFLVAEKPGRRMFFYPPRNGTPNGGFYVPVVDRWKKRRLEPGDGWNFSLSLGLGGDAESDRILMDLCKAGAPPAASSAGPQKGEAPLGIPESASALEAVYLSRPPRCDGSFSGWENVPVLARRGDALGDSRPRYAPNYSGKEDLSFVLKGGFDQQYLYLLVTVMDNIHQQDNDGMNCWSGDSIQIAFDPLCEKKLSPNYIEIGLAVTPAGKQSIWCWHHPEQNRVGDLSGFCRRGVRRGEGTLEYELALPLAFLRPFAPERGELGFNLVAWDADGNGVEKWMGVTDGLDRGPKSPQEFKNLRFHLETVPNAVGENLPKLFIDGPLILADHAVEFSAGAIASAEELPAQLEIAFSGGPEFVRPLQAGFNSFRFTLAANSLAVGDRDVSAVIVRKGKRGTPVAVKKTVVNAEAMENRIAAVEKLNDRLKADIQTLKEKKSDTAYLTARAAIADYFIKLTRKDVSAKQIYRKEVSGAPRKMIPVDDKQRLFIFDRAIRNFDYLKSMLNDALAEADAALSGRSTLFSVPPMPRNVRAQARNGGIYLGDREVFFVGPNTWGLHYRDLDLFAAAGFNFFDIFQYRGDFVEIREEPHLTPIDDADYRFNGRLATRAEELGLYFYSRHYEGTDRFNPQHGELIRERDHWSGIPRFLAKSPSHLYTVTLYETFAKSKDRKLLSGEFRRHLLKKFGTVAEINRVFHTDYSSIDDCSVSDAGRNPALKYELFRLHSALNLENLRKANAIKRGIWTDRPFSTAFTLVNFQPWNPLEQCADYENIWKEFDYIGWDGGVGEFGTGYATRWSADEIMFCDLARSISPDKPITNQEVHIIPDGYHGDNDFDRIYLAMVLPYLHGRNTGVLWYWTMDWYSLYGEFFSERANSFHAFSTAALDLRRLVEEMVPYRSRKTPVALFYSVPSFADSGYIGQMTDVYEGLFFAGFPVRFVTEDMIASGALKDFRVLVTPDARRVSERVFPGISDFLDHGGRVLRFGAEALTRDEYGNPPASDRSAALAKCIGKKGGSAKEVFVDCCALLEELRLAPEIDLRSPDGKRIFALEYRSYIGNDGRKHFYAVNQNRHSVDVAMPPGEWEELIKGAPVGKILTLQPAGIRIFREKIIR